MYRCELCSIVIPPHTRANRVVVEWRATEYPSRAKAQNSRAGRRGKSFDDPGGAGYEIAREAMACRACAERHAVEAAEAEAEENAAFSA